MSESNIRKLLRALLEPLQAFENAAQAILDGGLTIDGGEGFVLDMIGERVGQKRNGAGDELYRRMLRAKIAANRSDTTANALIRIVRAALGDDDVAIVLEPMTIDAIAVHLRDGTVAPEVAAAIIVLLRIGKSPDMRLVLDYTASADSDTFAFAPTAYLAGAHLAGATTLTVGDASGLPVSGTLTIAKGLAVEESIAFVRASSTTIALAAGLANNQADRTACNVPDPARAFGVGHLRSVLE